MNRLITRTLYLKIMTNFNLRKFKNLAKYLGINNINENNYAEVINKFFLIPYKHTDKNKNTHCFCGRPLTNYYYLINTSNNDVLIAGSGCKELFDNTSGDRERYFKKYFNSNFRKGAFIKIIDWNEYLENCIKKYLVNITENIEFEKLLELYKNNQFITDTIYKARKERSILEIKMYKKQIKKKTKRPIAVNYGEIPVYNIIMENTYCKIIF